MHIDTINIPPNVKTRHITVLRNKTKKHQLHTQKSLIKMRLVYKKMF